jgi:predicted transcriptional regulator
MSHWRHSGLDVVTVTPEKFESQAWRRSELATHIAKYGVRLKGSDCSLSETVPDSNAIKTKIKRIRAYVKALESKWTRFDALMKDKYAIKVKLDVLRLEIMRRGLAVPPTALLTDLAKTEGIDLQQAFDKAISSSEFSIAVKLRSKLLKLTQPVAHA